VIEINKIENASASITQTQLDMEQPSASLAYDISATLTTLK